LKISNCRNFVFKPTIAIAIAIAIATIARAIAKVDIESGGGCCGEAAVGAAPGVHGPKVSYP